MNEKIDAKFKHEAVVPFWMWNDRLEKNKLIEQLKEIKSKGMRQVIVHARFGLETSYLSDEWFDVFGAVLNEAEKEQMGIWVYDELNWPSGYADGQVLDKDPQFRAKHIVRSDSDFEVRDSTWRPSYSKGYYTDVLNPKATDTFLEVTHEQYWQRFKRHFGKTILGFFTDEPGMYNNFAGVDPNSLPWSEGLPEFFKKRMGYDLKEKLPLIWERDNPNSVEIRVDFWETVSELYQESYFKRIQDWCHQHNVSLIGHVLAEESLVDTAKTQGDFFAAMKYLDFAGYDLLGGLNPKTVITAKLAQSASHLYGLKGVIAETFGIFGWDLTLEELQRVAKWQIEMGLDVLIPHALFYSLRDARRNDCPPSFFAPKFWNKFDEFVSLFRQLKKEHKDTNPTTAIYYPIETIWGQLLPNDSKKADRTDQVFQSTTLACYNNRINFDYINSESVLKKGINIYSNILLPNSEVLPRKILEALLKFAEQGGNVVTVGKLPRLATKEKDQPFINSSQDRITSLFHQIEFKENLNLERQKKGLKDILRYLVSQKFSPIWYARTLRAARLLGYKRGSNMRQLTGLEKQLSELIN